MAYHKEKSNERSQALRWFVYGSMASIVMCGGLGIVAWIYLQRFLAE